MKLAERLRNARKEHSLTMKKTATLIDVSPSQYVHVELGERKLLSTFTDSQVLKLSQILEIPVE